MLTVPSMRVGGIERKIEKPGKKNIPAAEKIYGILISVRQRFWVPAPRVPEQ
jgi:hypothetical protein